MLNLATEYVTPEEYLASEIVSEDKHEYFSGRVLAMAGASFAHNRIVGNLLRDIGGHIFGSSCDINPSDLRVTTPFSSSFMYPDVTIVCGKPEKKEGQFDTLINPTVIIEVGSPSTKAFDADLKFFYYRQIPSFMEYFLIDTSSYTIDIGRKQSDGTWESEIINGLDNKLFIRTIDLHLPMDRIYYRAMLDKV